MTIKTELPALTSRGHALDREPGHMGFLQSSIDLLPDPHAQRRRMAEDGYLFLPGLLDAELIGEARRCMLARLASEGHLTPGTDPDDAIAATGYANALRPDLIEKNPAMRRVLYSGALIDFFTSFFDRPVRHFDFTWIRAMGRGHATPSHCDSVYMNRGTQKLFTAWVPFGRVGFDLGGLMILRGSNNHRRLQETYAKYDVDTFCENRPEIHGWKHGGALGDNPNQIRRSLGGQWLVGEFSPGDVLIFSIATVHASTDNHTDHIRLSSDTRYQPADEPADERWIGPNPVAHSQAGKRGRIC